MLGILLVMACNFIHEIASLLGQWGLVQPTSTGFSVLEVAAIPLALLAILILWILRRSKAAELGLARPENWGRTILLGLLVAAGIKILMLGWAYVLQATGLQEPDLSRHEAVRGNLGFLLMMLTASWTTAAFGEEIIWRGFMMGQIARLFNDSRFGWIFGLFASSAVFGLLHAYQSLPGMLTTALVGLILGAAYLIFRRNLWIAIIAHGTTNTVSFIMLYLGMGG